MRLKYESWNVTQSTCENLIIPSATTAGNNTHSVRIKFDYPKRLIDFPLVPHHPRCVWFPHNSSFNLCASVVITLVNTLEIHLAESLFTNFIFAHCFSVGMPMKVTISLNGSEFVCTQLELQKQTIRAANMPKFESQSYDKNVCWIKSLHFCPLLKIPSSFFKIALYDAQGCIISDVPGVF